MKRLRFTLVALAVVCSGAAVLGWWLQTPHWPHFPASASDTPQVIVDVDRDYAYHVGDVIVLNLYVQQKPHTIVDPSTLAVDGDFELAGKPQIDTKKLKDGTVVYRLSLKLQSFQVKPELGLDASMAWSGEGGDRNQVKIPKTSLYWSNTYDGIRDNLKEGDDARLPFYWYGGRHILALSLSSFLFLLLSVVAVRNYIRNRRVPQIDIIRKQVVHLLELVKSGSRTKEQHLELDGLIRAHYGVGPIPAGQLDNTLLSTELVAFLQLNEPAVYAQETLDEERRSRLLQLADKLLSGWQSA